MKWREHNCHNTHKPTFDQTFDSVVHVCVLGQVAGETQQSSLISVYSLLKVAFHYDSCLEGCVESGFPETSAD